MLAGVVLTALYMTRQMIYVFFGSRTRSFGVHAHESPRVMTMPLIVLALCSILFVLVLTPAWPWLHAYLNGEPARVDLSLLIQPMLFLSLALVAGGIGLGWLIYRNASEVDPLARAQPGLFRFLENKMWFDEIYEQTIIALSRMLSRLADWLDRYFWDGLVRLFAGLAQAFGVLSKGFDDHGINAGVDETTAGTRGFGRLIAAAHSGQIQTYLGAIAIGMLASACPLRMAWLITTLIVVPIVGALLVGATRNYARGVALAFNLLTAIGAFLLWRSFDSTLPGLQLVERHSWIPAIGAEYLVGIDGLSLLLVILTSLVFPFAFLAQSAARDRGFCALMLIMQAALYGTFTAQNFVLWFLFYEMSLIPAFLLIKIWGGEKRDRAATKFFLYTFLGSVAMLLSFLGIYFARGTFDFAALADSRKNRRLACRQSYMARLRRNLSWPRGQSSALSFSHLAAGRL